MSKLSKKTSLKAGKISCPHYFYSASWQYAWVNLAENTLAECYLPETRHYFKLTDRYLYIVRNKNSEKQTEKIWQLNKYIEGNLRFKRLFLPLIIGGICAPLAFVALFGGLLRLWVGLTIFFTGILLMIYGYKGSYQLIIRSENSTFSLFLDEKNAALIKFLHQLNRIVKKK